MGQVSADAVEIWDGQYRTVSEMAVRYLPAITPDNQTFLISLGRAVMGWNTLEGSLRVLLDVLTEEDGGAGRATVLALSAETSIAGLELAVEALAKAVLDKDRMADVKFVVDYLALVRGYRNYYVHGVNHLSTHQGSTTSPVLRWSAKRGIKYNIDQVTAEDLEQLANWSALGSAYIMAMIDWWYPVKLNGQAPPRPERPPLPPELKKKTHDLTYYRTAPSRATKRK